MTATDAEFRRHIEQWAPALSVLALRQEWRSIRSTANDVAFSAVSRTRPSDALAADPAIRTALRSMSQALAQSLGWDLERRTSIAGRNADQRFSGLRDSERLKRCGQVLAAFGLTAEWQSLQAFAAVLQGKGAKFRPQDRSYWASSGASDTAAAEPGAPAMTQQGVAPRASEISVEHFRAEHAAHVGIAQKELVSGRKRTHWIWYLFPQVAGLGSSRESVDFSLYSIAQAQAFFLDDELGGNFGGLLRIAHQYLRPPDGTEPARSRLDGLFGRLDARKFLSSLTLFESVCQPTESLRTTLVMAQEILGACGRCTRTPAIVAQWPEQGSFVLVRRDSGWQEERSLVRRLAEHGWNLVSVELSERGLRYAFDRDTQIPSSWDFDVNAEGALQAAPQTDALNRGAIGGLELIAAVRDRMYVRYYARFPRNAAPERWDNRVETVQAASADAAEQVACTQFAAGGWRIVSVVNANDGWLAYLKRRAGSG